MLHRTVRHTLRPLVACSTTLSGGEVSGRAVSTKDVDGVLEDRMVRVVVGDQDYRICGFPAVRLYGVQWG